VIAMVYALFNILKLLLKAFEFQVRTFLDLVRGNQCLFFYFLAQLSIIFRVIDRLIDHFRGNINLALLINVLDLRICLNGLILENGWLFNNF